MKTVIAIGLAVFCSVSQGQSLVPSTIVNSLASYTTPREGFTRLRLNLSSNELSSNEVVRLAGVAVCSKIACYEAAAPSSVAISSTANGMSTLVAELEVPFTEIVSVRFKAAGGVGLLQGALSLPKALVLEPGLRGGDVLVIVQKRGGNFTPVAAAANFLQPEGTTIYYNPTFATKVELTHGVSLAIPAGAHATPQVFLIGVHDTGDVYPLVDIFPSIRLVKPMAVSMVAVQRASTAIRSSQPPKTQRPDAAAPAGGVTSQSRVAQSAGALSFEINVTGVVRQASPGSAASRPEVHLKSAIDVQSGDSTLASATLACNPAGWCNCADQIAFPQNQQIIFNGLAPTGTEYLDWCTTIAPYVHISISNIADARERFSIRHDNKVQVSSVMRLPLQRITNWSQNTQAMVNGFTWEGDQGVFAGGFGLANGYVTSLGSTSGNIYLGINMIGGGTCGDRPYDSTCGNADKSAGNKLILDAPQVGSSFSWSEGSLPAYGGTVSSSTSIVKNGVCSSDTLVSRWSAVGTTPTGRMVFLSSTSDGTTSAAELCSVFKAMGVANAIRLDGGPSAAMTVDGILKNPLTGAYFVKYGSARYIPYTLKVSYPGW